VDNQNTPKPVDIIRREQEILKHKIEQVVTDFVDKTGLAVRSIDVNFVETTPISGPFETHLSNVDVVYEDIIR
jgi:hypothetical protein